LETVSDFEIQHVTM